MVSERKHTFPAGVQGPHVEDVNALHLAEDFETLETGGLFEIGGDGTGFGTGGEQVGFGLDFCGRGWLAGVADG